GNPIPGSPKSAIATTSLSTVAAGTSCTVVRIPEDIEEHETALAELERDHVVPGRRCTVVRHNKSDSLIVVHDTSYREVTISEFVRARLLVTL
ncbi:MAG: ferrous iron transport protein A, partial [Actinobacteria bacterium]|nr:ferrous iron transport protein A [Actinomycetota bacterium]